MKDNHVSRNACADPDGARGSPGGSQNGSTSAASHNGITHHVKLADNVQHQARPILQICTLKHGALSNSCTEAGVLKLMGCEGVTCLQAWSRGHAFSLNWCAQGDSSACTVSQGAFGSNWKAHTGQGCSEE